MYKIKSDYHFKNKIQSFKNITILEFLKSKPNNCVTQIKKTKDDFEINYYTKEKSDSNSIIKSNGYNINKKKHLKKTNTISYYSSGKYKLTDKPMCVKSSLLY